MKKNVKERVLENEIFRVRKTSVEKEEFQIFLGNELACKTTFETEEQAWDYIDEKPWQLIQIAALHACMIWENIREKDLKKEEDKK